MNVDLEEIVQSVSRLASKEIPRFQEDTFVNTVPRELFRAFADLGITRLAIPEQFGGYELGMVATAAIMEEVAAVDLGPAIFLSVHNMVCGIINRLGSPEQKKRLLPALASGDSLGAFALTEPSAGSDAARLKSTAEKIEKDGKLVGYKLRGEKCYITSAGFADMYVVFARTKPFHEESSSDGISIFILETPGGKSPPGLTIHKPEKKMGCELSPIASLSFDDIILPPEALLGELHLGYKVALAGLAGGRVNMAACANGIARTAVQLAVDHLMEREQFGKKLAEFQGLQFMLADMAMKLEASRELTQKAAQALDDDFSKHGMAQSRARSLTSMAKCFSTDSAMHITTDAVQLLGGAGYIREYRVEKLMRDAKMLQIVEGTNQIQRVLIARHVLRE